MKVSFVLITLLSTVGVGVFAFGENTMSPKLRRSYMEALGGHMGSIGNIMKEKVDAPDEVLAHAESIAGISKYILNGFPKGSDKGKTEAKVEIWKNWDDFKKKAEEFQTASTKFLEVAKTKDMAKVGAAMGSLGESCKGCHKTYKKSDH